MRAFRVERRKFLDETLLGHGAALSTGNRWNSLNTPMVYTSGSRSLAILEVLAHVDLFCDLPNDRLLVEIEIPDALPFHCIKPNELMPGWDSFPSIKETRLLGDAFIRASKFSVLRVPSSLVSGEWNFLINPAYVEKHKIQVIDSIVLNLERWRR
jgi:RES domain-containing protein